MPAFDFLCEKCGTTFESTVKSVGNSRVKCAKCGGRKTRRLFSPFAISGKGLKSSGSSSVNCSTCGPRSCSTCS